MNELFYVGFWYVVFAIIFSILAACCMAVIETESDTGVISENGIV